LIWIKRRQPHAGKGRSGRQAMKRLCEVGAESSAAIAALLWFISARIRLGKRGAVKRGLASGIDDPRQVLLLVYQQSRWSAWAAIAAGLAALFALADGFF
jgi:hypothetical protein